MTKTPIRLHAAPAFCALVVALLAAGLPITAAAQINDGDVPPQSLEQAKAAVAAGAGAVDAKAVAERDLRSKAMREAANSYGARSGLLRGSYEIRQALNRVAAAYDATFNFAPLMLTDLQSYESGGDGRARLIRPPVIVQARAAYNQLDTRMIRERDAVYRIESNVEFVATPPNWRTYLYRDLGEKAASLPHYTLMPRNATEKANWDAWVADGWQIGYQQAKTILEWDLNRLARDFDGMVLYHDLLAQNVLSLPHVASRNDGVTGNDNALNVNDITLKITVIPTFQRDPTRWKPVMGEAQEPQRPYPAAPAGQIAPSAPAQQPAPVAPPTARPHAVVLPSARSPGARVSLDELTGGPSPDVPARAVPVVAKAKSAGKPRQ